MTYFNDNKATDLIKGYANYLFRIHGKHLANILRKIFINYPFLHEFLDGQACESLVWKSIIKAITYIFKNNKHEKEKIFLYLRWTVIQDGISLIRHYKKLTHKTFHYIKYFSEYEDSYFYDFNLDLIDKEIKDTHFKIDRQIIIDKIKDIINRHGSNKFLQKNFDIVMHYFNGKSYRWILDNYQNIDRNKLVRAIYDFKNLVKSYDFGY